MCTLPQKPLEKIGTTVVPNCAPPHPLPLRISVTQGRRGRTDRVWIELTNEKLAQFVAVLLHSPSGGDNDSSTSVVPR